jgi:hypothetical protein
MARYAEKLHIVPVLAPAATTAAIHSYAVRLKNTQWLSFLVNWGEMTSDAADFMLVTVEATTAVGNTTGASDVALPFVYRLSAAVGSDDWGESTTCANTGLSITAEQDNMALLIDIDPAAVQGSLSDAVGVRVTLDGVDAITNYATSVTALIEDRYPQEEHISAST